MARVAWRGGAWRGLGLLPPRRMVRRGDHMAMVRMAMARGQQGEREASARGWGSGTGRDGRGSGRGRAGGGVVHLLAPKVGSGLAYGGAPLLPLPRSSPLGLLTETIS